MSLPLAAGSFFEKKDPKISKNEANNPFRINRHT